MLPQSASMDIDGGAGQGRSSWSAYSSSASDISAASLGGVRPAGFAGCQQPIFGTGINFANRSSFASPTHPGSGTIFGQGWQRSDSSASSAAGSRRSSSTHDPFAQQQQVAQANVKNMPDRQATLRGNFVGDSMQNFVDSFAANPGDAAQWNVDWDLGSFSDSGLQGNDVNELLAKFASLASPLGRRPASWSLSI